MTKHALEPTGTFRCPICFWDEPHEHSVLGAEVHANIGRRKIAKVAKQQ